MKIHIFANESFSTFLTDFDIIHRNVIVDKL